MQNRKSVIAGLMITSVMVFGAGAASAQDNEEIDAHMDLDDVLELQQVEASDGQDHDCSNK